MTPEEIKAFGTKRHGKYWIGPLAEEVGYSFSQLYRVAIGESPVSRRLELEMKQLKRKESMKHLTVFAKRYE